jgi:hypothetical protein
MKFCVMVQPSGHLLVNTPIPKRSEYIDVKLAIQNYSALKPSFTLDAAGHLFTHRLQMMQLRYLKIARSLLVSALKFDVPVVIRI